MDNSSIMGSGGASTASRSNKYNVNKQIGASNILTSERGAGMGEKIKKLLPQL